MQTVPGIEIPGPVIQVFPGQQDLGDFPAIPAKILFIFIHQFGLADGRNSLAKGYLRGPASHSHLPDTGGHGTGRDQDDFNPFFHQSADLAGDGINHHQV